MISDPGKQFVVTEKGFQVFSSYGKPVEIGKPINKQLAEIVPYLWIAKGYVKEAKTNDHN
jgi:hypothetical protein